MTVPLDLVVRNARIREDRDHEHVDIGIHRGRIVAIEPALISEVAEVNAAGCLVTAGLVDTHIHLDKSCVMDRIDNASGTLRDAIAALSRLKEQFTVEDVYERALRTAKSCVSHGTMKMRTHVEVDPIIELRGFEGVQAAADEEMAWGLDIEICVFPQEGLLDNPGTDSLLVKALELGARAIGGAPYADRHPRKQIDRVFELAREFDVDVDLHLDLAETAEDMNIDYVCQVTEDYGYQGRVTVGHLTQLSYASPSRFEEVANNMLRSGVALTVLPSTDLYLTGHTKTHSKPRGIVPVSSLLSRGVNCSIATNNILNPFTPFGDGSLVRMANLYANVCHATTPSELHGCFEMVSTRAAEVLRTTDYGIAVGGPADLIAFRSEDRGHAIAELAQPLWGIKGGRLSFERPEARLHPMSGAS